MYIALNAAKGVYHLVPLTESFLRMIFGSSLNLNFHFHPVVVCSFQLTELHSLQVVLPYSQPLWLKHYYIGTARRIRNDTLPMFSCSDLTCRQYEVL